MDHPFIEDHDADELDIAGEFLTSWLPFLTRDLCHGCSQTLTDRIRSLRSDALEASDCAEHSRLGKDPAPKASPVNSDATVEQIDTNGRKTDADPNSSMGPLTSDSVDESPSGTEHIDQSLHPSLDPNPKFSAPDQLEESPRWSEHIEPSGWGTDPEPDQELNPNSRKVRMSWADMAQEEDELAEEEERARENEEVREGDKKKKKVELSREQREWIRFKNVGRKKDFICLERVKGKIVNILDGLELHTGVFSSVEQKKIIDFVYELQGKGQRSEFRERTYSEPQKWMRGKGRVTIQFGCCYNYAMDRLGNPPGILQNVAPDPIPSLFKLIIKRLVRWHVLPTSCIPDSCIVNIYEPGDCIPPHIDSYDFVRPFSTVSFLSQCNILFGSNLKIEGPGEFSGSTAIPLPVGVHGQLSPTFYARSCPNVQGIVRSAMAQAVRKEPRKGASILRLFFHDCFVNGCDASILLDDTATFTGEKNAGSNQNSARGFEVMDTIKSRVEASCNTTVSCADILALAARDGVVLLGGPTWTVQLGRRDSTTASQSAANSQIPFPFSSLSTLVSMFATKGLTARDMTALSGGHTIGQARCTTFRTHIYNETNIDPRFASLRQQTCPATGGDNNLAPLDILSPNGFGNDYFRDLVARRGLLHSDQELFNNGTQDGLVRQYSVNERLFASDFAAAMVKMGGISPLAGTSGQIRLNCRKILQEGIGGVKGHFGPINSLAFNLDGRS